MASVFKMSVQSLTEAFSLERRGGDTASWEFRGAVGTPRPTLTPVLATHYLRILLCAFILGFRLCASAATETNAPAQTNGPTRAKLKITGYGILGNRELKRIIKTVELGSKKPEFFGEVFVEDSALILSSRIKRDGYLKPKVYAYLTLEHGGHIRVEAQELLDNPLPRPLRIKEAHFKIEKGILYHYKKLEFEGLETITEKEARSYFVETGTLLNLKRYRIYTPEKLKRGLSSLEEVLDRQGFQEAKGQASEPI